ncbi:unnamed protein product [Caenorhabditis brenneri]
MKINSSCMIDSDFEEITGYEFKGFLAAFLVHVLSTNGAGLIGVQELRASLGFPPPGPWKHEREPTDEDTLEEYLDAKVMKKMWSLDSNWLHEKNLVPAFKYLDKHFPSIRKIYRHQLVQSLQSYEKKIIDRKTIDFMIQEFHGIRKKVDNAMNEMRSNWECEYEKEKARRGSG